jgi:hypothetical protein
MEGQSGEAERQNDRVSTERRGRSLTSFRNITQSAADVFVLGSQSPLGGRSPLSHALGQGE